MPRRSLAPAALLLLLASRVHGANFCDLIRCTSDVAPVCASNGVSYSNACLFQIARCNDESLKITRTGECEVAADATLTPTPTPTPTPVASVTSRPIATCEIMCIERYEPVCGSDGKTYGNSCKLTLANCNNRFTEGYKKVTVASDGECAAADATVGPATDAPANASIETVAPDADTNFTEPVRLCAILCADNYDPVCGSDGKTYSNSCELRRAACTSREELTEASKGECAASDASSAEEPTAVPASSTPVPAPADTNKCSDICPQIYSPVCGSDGKTYSNKCAFNVAKCKAGFSTTMAVASEGECVAESDAEITPVPTPSASAEPAASGTCRKACTRIFKPVCGSDGVTYTNKCEFDNAKCTKRIATMSYVEGACAQ